MIKAVFSASLLQSSESHYSSEIILICWFAAQETFIMSNIYLWKQLCCFIFFWKTIHFFKILWIIKCSKEHLFEIEILCNIINDFTVTLISLMHPCYFLFNLTDPNFSLFFCIIRYNSVHASLFSSFHILFYILFLFHFPSIFLL